MSLTPKPNKERLQVLMELPKGTNKQLKMIGAFKGQTVTKIVSGLVEAYVAVEFPKVVKSVNSSRSK